MNITVKFFKPEKVQNGEYEKPM